MEILKYRKLKNNQIKIIFKDKSELLTYEDVLLKNNILLKKELNEEDLFNISNDNWIVGCYYDALKYLSHRLRSIKETIDYLNKKNYPSNIISDNIDKLIKQGYLNDKRYISSYINDKISFSSLGPLKIKQELLKLIDDPSTIDESLSKIDSLLLEEKVNKIITRLIKSNKTKSGSILKKKIYTYLISLGYDKEIIIRNMSKYSFSNNKNNLNNDYQKLFKKYQNKYDENKLKYVRTQKLLLKGYTKDEINGIIIL